MYTRCFIEDLMLLYYPVNLLLNNKHNYSYSKYHPSTGGEWVTRSVWTGRLCLVTQTRRRLPSLEHSYTRPPVSSSSVICARARECALCALIGSSLISCLSSAVPHPHHCSLLFQLRSWLPARITISFFVAAQHCKKQRDRQKQKIKPTSA
jgi:hypothetical protein